MFKNLKGMLSKQIDKFQSIESMNKKGRVFKDIEQLGDGLRMLTNIKKEFPKVQGAMPSVVMLLSEKHYSRWIVRYEIDAPEKYYTLNAARGTLSNITDVELSGKYITYKTHPNRVEILETYVVNHEDQDLGKYVVKDT